MAVLSYRGAMPQIGKGCFVAESSTICGNVSLGEESSVWFGASIRAELESVKIGVGSNVQDNCVIHTDLGFPVEVGDKVSLGHGAIIHGSIVRSNCLIGMGSILMNGSRIEEDTIVAAGSLVLQGARFPPRSLVLGSPASVKRQLRDEEIERIRENAKHYSEFRDEYLSLSMTQKRDIAQFPSNLEKKKRKEGG